MAWHSSTLVHLGLPLAGLLLVGGATPLTNAFEDKGKLKDAAQDAAEPRKIRRVDSASNVVSPS